MNIVEGAELQYRRDFHTAQILYRYQTQIMHRCNDVSGKYNTGAIFGLFALTTPVRS